MSWVEASIQNLHQFRDCSSGLKLEKVALSILSLSLCARISVTLSLSVSFAHYLCLSLTFFTHSICVEATINWLFMTLSLFELRE